MIRPRTILGRDRLGIFQILFELVRRGRPIYVLGRGTTSTSSFTRTTSPTRASAPASTRAPPCSTWGPRSSGRCARLSRRSLATLERGAASIAAHEAGGEGDGAHEPAWVSRRLVPYHSLMYGREMYFDVAPVKAALGWRATRSNEEMLIESYDYYLQSPGRDPAPTRSLASPRPDPVRHPSLARAPPLKQDARLGGGALLARYVACARRARDSLRAVRPGRSARDAGGRLASRRQPALPRRALASRPLPDVHLRIPCALFGRDAYRAVHGFAFSSSCAPWWVSTRVARATSDRVGLLAMGTLLLLGTLRVPPRTTGASTPTS